jgi:uncharacterized membrane protein
MGIRDMSEDRLAAALNWVQANIEAKVPPGIELKRFTFDQFPVPTSSFDSLTATGSVTSIANALELLGHSLAQESASLGQNQPRTAAVVLCSDGGENLRKDGLVVARNYRRRGIPVYTLTVGTTAPMRDIAIDNIQVRRAVSSDMPTHVGVTLRSFGFTGTTVPVQVLLGNEVLASQQVVLGRGTQELQLEFLPHGKGFQVFEVSVPLQPGEWLATNNRRRFGIELRDPTIRVIYMEGSPLQGPKSEWKYLKEALESDPAIKVDAFYRPQVRGGQSVMTVDTDPSSGDVAYHVEHPTKGYPRTLAKLLDYDVVINSDIYKEAFSEEQLEATVRLVEEYGGGFVMIGGDTAFGSGGYQHTVIDKLLPVAIETEVDQSWGQTRAAFPPGAFQHPLMAIGNSPEETVEIWTKTFPSFYGYNKVDRAKPGAVVLLTDSAQRNRYGPRILIAAQEVGKGRSMAFTSDTTRDWGRDFETIWGEKIRENEPLSERNCDSRYYRRFWLNAIRWLAAGRISKANEKITLELAHSICNPGDTVEATVGLVEPRSQKPTVKLELLSGGATNQSVNAHYDAASGFYRAELHPASAADYTVLAHASGIAGEARQILCCEQTDREMENPQANPQLMADLARVSGGEVLRLDAPANNRLFSCLPIPRVEEHRESIWDRGWILGLLIVLLSSEWIFRKLKGLS